MKRCVVVVTGTRVCSQPNIYSQGNNGIGGQQ